MPANKQLNDQKEEHCFMVTHERKYYHIETTNTFVKRSLRPREWQKNFAGELIVPQLAKERLLNEAAALEFVPQNTTVPVPKLYAYFEDDGAIYLIVEYIEGKGMNELEDEKLVIQRQLEQYLQQLHKLRSRNVGGPSGFIVPPCRVQEETSVDKWTIKPSQLDSYVFCHNDVSQPKCHRLP